MDGTDLKKALEAARALERKGEIAAAADAYARLGMIEEAVRTLAGDGKLLEAARVILAALGPDVRAYGGLTGTERKLAFRAAVLLGEGGQHARAAEIFQILGDRDRADDARKKAAIAPQAPQPQRPAASFTPDPALLAQAQQLEADGKLDQALPGYVSLRRWADAGRLARRLGRPLEAAQHYAEAGLHYEAAVCFHEARDEARCLDQLTRVPPHHERYRGACVQAVRLASSRDLLTFQIDRLLGPFLASAPQGEKELDAFYTAARLYERNAQQPTALEILDRILRASPYYRDVSQLIGALQQRSSQASRDARIRQEDASFHQQPARTRSSSSELLDDLPDLPDLPPLPGATPPPRGKGTAVIPSPAPAPQAPAPAALTAAHASPSPYASTQAVQAPQAPAVFNPGAIPAGTLFADRYRIEAKLGQGGMASVYRAHDLELGEDIAIKVFLPTQESPELVARFKQELLIARQLSHSNVVRLHDIGTALGCRFLTMEILHGHDLNSLLKGLGRPIDFLPGLRYLIQASAGLNAAHERGVIHRDVKPDNFFIVAEGDTLKVMDFGIAKRQNAAGITQAGYLAGTPSYIAPEQISNFASVTPQADLYALGVVAYQMFTGRVPFEHEELMGLLVMHLSEAPPPPTRFNPSIPPDLERLILRLLEKDPARRPNGCRELARSLQEIGASLARTT